MLNFEEPLIVAGLISILTSSGSGSFSNPHPHQHLLHILLMISELAWASSQHDHLGEVRPGAR
jgi:hypothetical protein